MQSKIFVSILLFIITGCSNKQKFEKAMFVQIRDVMEIPQQASYISDAAPNNGAGRKKEEFRAYLMSPWHKHKLSGDSDLIISEYRKPLSDCYRENLQKCDDTVYLSKLVDNANFVSINGQTSYGIMVAHANLRKMPTDLPCFSDITKAGEGYPFDNLQNSFVYAGTPVFISHMSQDRAWVVVETPSSDIGFVKVSEVAILKKHAISSLSKLDIAILLRDDVPIYDSNGYFWGYSKLSMPLFVKEKHKGYYSVLLPMRGNNSGVLWKNGKIPMDIARMEPLEFTKENVDDVIQNLIGQNYGWGGYLGNRDCSALIRDYFAAFGIGLPRNSLAQSQEGRIIKLAALNRDEKLKIITKEAVPFRTILYCPGHIVLYVGSKKDKLLILHNIWGSKIQHGNEKGRNIIGATIISTLEFGKELRYIAADSTFLDKISSMSIF
ncbi:putative SH3 domain glycoside hydrolase [Rickettsiales endosymbiont of Paramecium tredecaurelia]|uniref:C40 family peptidase n=1 Tax=Candidatus Sarmatiella mevalonica TaxID=2770581 RepID=UPI0019226B61|nr:SH3 domain-containing C40 family peptidase [Candidatus Sarmatiella mevalonica]MBL3285288.1 putative SH3 domain glycoside hydrolase [Candidatus Sarmatiella mevalonica]